MNEQPFPLNDEDECLLHHATHTPNYLLGALGGIAGGILGYFGFAWLLRQGMHAMVLPGALIGLGCGFLLGRRSILMGTICAVAALVLGVFCEWQFMPFVQDDSLEFFVRNLHNLRTGKQLMILLGAAVAFWCGQGRG